MPSSGNLDIAYGYEIIGATADGRSRRPVLTECWSAAPDLSSPGRLRFVVVERIRLVVADEIRPAVKPGFFAWLNSSCRAGRSLLQRRPDRSRPNRRSPSCCHKDAPGFRDPSRRFPAACRRAWREEIARGRVGAVGLGWMRRILPHRSLVFAAVRASQFARRPLVVCASIDARIVADRANSRRHPTPCRRPCGSRFALRAYSRTIFRLSTSRTVELPCASTCFVTVCSA